MAHFETNVDEIGRMPADRSGFAAGVTLEAYQYHIVTLTGDKIYPCTVDDVPYGILQNKPKSGQQTVVRIAGVSKLRVSTAGLDNGDHYGPDDDSHGVAKILDKDYILGEVIIGSTTHTLHGIASVTVNGGGILNTISKTNS